MTSKLLIASVLLAATTIGCKSSYDGEIKVSQAFVPISKKNRVVPVGTHQVEVKISEDKAKVEIEIENGKDAEFSIALPGFEVDKNEEGTTVINLKSGQSKQSFDVKGALKISKKVSSQYQTTEACDVTTSSFPVSCDVLEYGCGATGTKYPTSPGVREILARDIYTTRALDLSLVTSSGEVAKIEGVQRDNEVVVDMYLSQCYIQHSSSGF